MVRRVLWPLFHYVPTDVEFDNQEYNAYKEANLMFFDEVQKYCKEGDMVWIHDYHLMHLPEMIRRKFLSNIKIGFFFHTPFPTSEIYKTLPVREELLKGVISCDLVGFHTYEYVRHFIQSCSQILKLETTPTGVKNTFLDVDCKIGTFPIGIEPNLFQQACENEAVKDRVDEIRKKVTNCSVILGVDRLDYIKGVPQKLYALDCLLQKHPDKRGKVALIQVAVPTRTDVKEYIQLKNLVEGLVGQINGRFGKGLI